MYFLLFKPLKGESHRTTRAALSDPRAEKPPPQQPSSPEPGLELKADHDQPLPRAPTPSRALAPFRYVEGPTQHQARLEAANRGLSVEPGSRAAAPPEPQTDTLTTVKDFCPQSVGDLEIEMWTAGFSAGLRR